MAQHNIGGLLEKRRSALVEYCIGQVGKPAQDKFNFLRTPGDLFELLRLDPLDSYPVQSSWVAEATSCAQQFIHAAYRKLEPGYEQQAFDPKDLKLWELYNNYPDWAAVAQIGVYPENFINPFVRQRKTGLFKTLENDLNQTRLNSDSVQRALQNYLQTFEQTCNLDVLSGYMDGTTPSRADYYFIGRQRVPPFQCFWRKAEIELAPGCTAINPVAWGEWQPVDIGTGDTVLDIRPVFWGGRLCVVWAQWRNRTVEVVDGQPIVRLPYRLEINLAFMTQNGQWSAPLSLHASELESDVSASARLIATVAVGDRHPKGVLGVSLRNATPNLNVFVVRDVLMRPVPEDNGTWLDFLALYRFPDALTVQHPLSAQNQPTVTAEFTAPGSLTSYYGLQVLFISGSDKDRLVVRGMCKLTALVPATATFTLTLLNPASGDPQVVEVVGSTVGGWATPWMQVERTAGGFTANVQFTLGGTAVYGTTKFTLAMSGLPRFVPAALEKNTANAAQFIAFKQTGTLAHARLNSLFGPELVQRAHVSVEAVLDWETQFLMEPPPDSAALAEPNGAYNGANGLYFWELSFHLPHLVAIRLRAEDRYQDAQNWLHYLFDPRAPANEASIPSKPAYWRCRPLVSDGNLGCESQLPIDPDAIGYSAPRHLRILVFIEYVKNLIAWGDWYYRQLTRDNLVAAKLCYVQAEFLMGKPPVARAVTDWETTTVGQLLTMSSTRPALEQFEKNLEFALADIPPSAQAAPLLGLLANEPFKLPINGQLLDLFDLPGRRLNNLRNNLTLDGKPLDIPLFSPPTNPNQLLRDLAAGGVGGPRSMGGRLVVGAFHWRVVFDIAMRSVQALQDYGSQVLRLLEQRDRAEQEETQQSHLVELGDYARAVQEQSIAQLEANVTSLIQSRATARERADTYARWYEENVSAVEYEVMENLQVAKKLHVASTALQAVGAAIDSVPNIFGLANGGHRPGSIAYAVGNGLELASAAVQIDADKQAVTETYRLRRREWELQRNQAMAETLAIDEQIAAQRIAVDAARASLDQTLRGNAQALTVYNFMKKRATNAELFGWLLGQLKALHYQAYDAVLSLCLNAQSSLSAETGEYDSVPALPQVWLDNRYGLTAGEHLREYLLRMERRHLQSHERRLDRVKTVSLRRLFDDASDPQAVHADWHAALDWLQGSGVLEFKLTQLLFDREHPGDYCRLINSVEVDLPVLVGPYEDVRATLQQIGSTTATRASAHSVEYLLWPDETVAPADVQFNLRSGQQIGLSVGIADNGMSAIKPDEGLLNPFENTGAVSRWQLNFPWPKKAAQSAMLDSLTDVIVRIRYTAKGGEPSFRLAVENLVNRAENSGLKRAGRGGHRHE
ncbi:MULTISPECIES: neuraminidase-like domain-containing protein [unclassified Pseudomonas]|uniref:Tc toxin subunit A-related protein n=1 Tax=unclassified Pseudomonas TaxID=196821 RepID=UPI002AC8E189|nr:MULTISPECIES: neuraminidase-like domain-containing protein [unclassified Pseudomonas]MEB0046399.1 neuraminidase-like domain-containing protein [Pseudomonas sp. Dout3]MEB0097676.1 neuraminidase-like domain-containing protein [Pseudomonas sp. DC1.2]WPX57735.1 neuraminidase-like domain-containing protein [Pseudomonas sp. DC1.2]